MTKKIRESENYLGTNGAGIRGEKGAGRRASQRIYVEIEIYALIRQEWIIDITTFLLRSLCSYNAASLNFSGSSPMHVVIMFILICSDSNL